MKQLYLITLLIFGWMVSAQAQTDTLWSESFETDGSGSRYTLSAAHINDGGFEDYFERGTDTDFSGYGMDMAPITGEDGTSYIGAEDIDAAGIAGSAVTITFNDVSISNYENLSIIFKLAALQATNFDYATRSNGDYVLIEYAVDGGSYDTLTLFTTEVDASSQLLKWDTDGDGFGDSLTSADFTDYTFDIPETGSTLSLRVQMRTDAGDEEIALDNFLVSGDLNVSGDTDSEVLTPTAQAAASTINANTITLADSAKEVFAFRMQDLGTADGQATAVTQMVFEQAAANTLADWTDAIAGVELWEGGAKSVRGYTATVNATNLTINFDTSYTIADGTTTGDLSLRIWLKAASTVVDDAVIAVEVPTSNPGFSADGGSGSVFNSTFTSAVTGNAHTIAVLPTTFAFAFPKTTLATGVDFELTLSATNDNGAVAKTTNSVTLALASGTGNLTSTTGLTANLVDGVFTWTDLQYDAAEDFSIEATNNTETYNLTSTTLTGINPIVGPTTLKPGDVALVGFNSDGDDDIAILALTDIGSDTKIFITDDEWNGVDGFNTGEGFLSYTAPVTGVPAGSIIHINKNNTEANDGGAIAIEAGSFSLGTSGDHVYLYQAATYNASNPTVLYAFNSFGNWFSDQIDNSGLKEGITAITPVAASTDNAEYQGSTNNTPLGLLTLIADGANWATDNTTPYTFSTTAFTLATPDVVMGASVEDVPADTINANHVISVDSAVAVFDFAVSDGANDGLTTEVTAMSFTPAASNTVANWANVIAGARLWTAAGSARPESYTVTIDSAEIRLEFATSLSVPDNVSDNMHLAIYLKDTSLVTDGEVIALEINEDMLCWGFDPLGSTPAITLSSAVTGSTQMIDVIGTKFQLEVLTDPLFVDSSFAMDLTVVNDYGAVDLGAPQSVSLSTSFGSGSLSSATSGITPTLSNGTFSWTDLKYNAEEQFVIQADHDQLGFSTKTDTLTALDASETIVFLASSTLQTREDSTAFDILVSINSESDTAATVVELALVVGDSLDLGSYTTQTVTFPAGSAADQSVTVTITDDELLEGTETFTFVLQNVSGGKNASIVTPDTLVVSLIDNENVIINEIDADQTSTDSQEFVELYDGGAGNISLDGYVLVFYNGSDDRSYGNAIDLDGYTTDANGYFVVGSSTTLNVDLAFGAATNNLQNGADAVALYYGLDATDFPEDTDLNLTSALVDAIVYDTDDSDDAGLAALLLVGTQVNENGLNDKDNHSVSRLPNGAGDLRDATYWSVDLATPGEPNQDNNFPSLLESSPFDGQDNVAIGADLSITFTEAFNPDSTAALQLLKNDGTGLVAVQTILLNAAEVSYSGTTISFDLDTLQAGTQYIARLDSGAVADNSGNVSDEISLEFFTAGSIPTVSLITTPFQSNPVLDFGRVDTAASQIIAVTVSGSSLVGNVNLALGGSSAGQFLLSTDTLTFAATLSLSPDVDGKVSQTVYLKYGPDQCGDANAQLVINTPNGNQLTAELNGTGIGGSCTDFYANTDLIDFGVVTLNSVAVDSFFVTAQNLGLGYITFSDSAQTSFSISQDNSTFETQGLTLSGTFTNAPVFVRFDGASTPGNYAETLVLVDSQGQTYGELELRGAVQDADSLLTITEARALPLGTTVAVAGRVIAANDFGGPAYIQDDSAGLAIFWPAFHEGTQVGDSVIVMGELTEFNSLKQIGGSAVYFTVISGANAPVTPTHIAASDLANYESMLVTITAEFDQKNDLLYPNSNYTLTDSAGTGFELRIDNNTNLVGRTRPQAQENITAVVSRFGSNFQVLPRGTHDLPGTGEYASEGNNYPVANTFDVVTWNMEFFGSKVDGFGPNDKDLQLINARELILALEADVIAVQEVSDEQTLQQLVNLLPGWDRMCSDVWTRSFEPADPTFPPQKLCILYNTATVTITDTRVIFEEFYTQERTTPNLLASHPGGGASSFWSSGRLPWEVTLDATIDGITETYTLINLHAKSGSGSNDIARKTFDAQVLKDTLDADYADRKFIILGDFNDDLDISIDGSSTSPYAPFVSDTANYATPTLALSQAGLRSTVGFDNVIDHQVFSNEVVADYLTGGVEVFIPFGLIDNYGNTTSDHLPVITRHDFTPYEVAFVETDTTVVEGVDTLTIALAVEPATVATTLTISVDLHGATLDSDVILEDSLVGGSFTLTIPANATEASFNMVVVDDPVLEQTDTLVFTISGTDATRTLSSPDTYTVYLMDNDGVTASFDQSAYTLAEGTSNEQITISLNQAAEVAVEVTVDVFEITASSSDYSTALSLPHTFTIAAGDTLASFALDIVDDSLQEAEETFAFVLSSSDANVSTADTTLITIPENDVVIINPTVTLVINETTVVEGDTITGRIDITDASATDTTTVYLLTSGDFSSDLDGFVVDTVQFLPGDSASYIFSILVTDDTLQEADEVIPFLLSAGAEVNLGTPNTDSVIILANDAPVVIEETQVNFNPTSATLSEGDSTLTLTLEITAPDDSAATTVAVALTSGHAGDLDNYTTQTVTFPAGSSASQSLTIHITDDVDVEATETFVLSLSSVSGGYHAAAGEASAFTLTLTDNDSTATNPTTVAFASASVMASEADSAFTLTVQITNPNADTATSVEVYLASGDTTDLLNYAPTTVTFAAGSLTAQSVSYLIHDDTDVEGTESLTFGLRNLAGAQGASVSSPAETVVSLTDNDTVAMEPAEVFFLSTSAEVNEDAGTLTLSVGITNPSADTATTVEVALTAGDQADLGGYTTQTVTFDPGSTTAQLVTLTITDDSTYEDTEVFTFSLQNVTGAAGAGLGNANAFTLTVTDNDPVPVPDTTVVSFVAASGSVSEDAGTISLVLSITNPSDSATTVQVSVSSGDATKVGDFRSQTVTFPAGSDADQSIAVSITDNDFDEADATVVFALSGGETASDNVVVIEKDTFTLTILDEDEVTSLDENWLEGVSLYPNPTQAQLTVALPEGLDYRTATLKVLTAQGTEVLRRAANGTETSLNVSSLASGMYILQVTTADKSAMVRFQITR